MPSEHTAKNYEVPRTITRPLGVMFLITAACLLFVGTGLTFCDTGVKIARKQ